MMPREEYVRLQLEVSDGLESAFLSWCRLNELPEEQLPHELIQNIHLTPDQKIFLSKFIQVYELI